VSYLKAVNLCQLKEGQYDQEQFARRKKEKFSKDKYAFFASVEDVILKNLEYYLEGRSEKHLEDIRGIISTFGAEIDSAYITRWAKERGTLEVWRELRM
jgi:hypothetical protein